MASGACGYRSRSSGGSRFCRRSSSAQPAARSQRPLAAGRPQPQHDPPLRRDARRARLPAAGRRDAQVPARPARARPRLLGDQLDGAAPHLGAASAAAQRRDRTHREHGGPRRRRTSSTSSAAGAARAARDRPQPPRRLAPAGVLHVDGQGAARVPARRRAERARRRLELARRGPNTITAKRAFAAGARARARAGLAVNNEELAYGLRSIAAPVRSQTGDVVAAINIAVHRSMVSMDELLDELAPALERTAGRSRPASALDRVAHGGH